MIPYNIVLNNILQNVVICLQNKQKSLKTELAAMAQLTEEQFLKCRLTRNRGNCRRIREGQRRFIIYTEDELNLENQNSNNKPCIKFMPSLMESA